MRRGTRQSLGIVVLCALGVMPACDEGPTPIPIQRSNGGPGISLPINVSVTGIVRDETGLPIANALVGVQTFSWHADDYVWDTARTDSNGRYQISFGIWTLPGQGELAVGKASLDGDDYQQTLQLVPTTATNVTRDFLLRRIRSATSDESVTVSFDAESSLCNDLPRAYKDTANCEIVRVTAMRGGLITVDVRPVEAGGVSPIVSLQDFQSTVPGRASMLVEEGKTYRVRIQVPAGSSPAQYIVSSSFQ